MPATKVDEELVEGLSKAKKSPRNFALIVKGAAPVKLLIKKKNIKDADLQKAKAEAKGTDSIVGVIEGSGSEFVFKVQGDKEPSVLAMKIKEMIGEETGMTVKARWELVKELPKLPDDENDSSGQGTQQPAPGTQPTTSPQNESIPNAPSPPPPPAINANQLLATMNKLSPQVQAAVKNFPDRRNDFAQTVAAFQKQMKGEQLEEARASLAKLIELLKSLAAPSSQAQPQAAKFSLVKLGKARIEWASVRDKAVADIKRLKDAIGEEFGNDTEQAQPLASAFAKLDGVMQQLEVRLPESLDAILNGDETTRNELITSARQMLSALNRLCEEDEIVAELDGNEVLEGFAVVGPMRAKLAEIAAALG